MRKSPTCYDRRRASVSVIRYVTNAGDALARSVAVSPPLSGEVLLPAIPAIRGGSIQRMEMDAQQGANDQQIAKPGEQQTQQDRDDQA